MKVINIYGEGFDGQESKARIACRAVVMQDGKLLLSYETKTGKWMLPGGGLENGETDAECCVRETEEETGLRIEAGACFLEIREYFPDSQWVNRYFLCTAVGEGQMRRTKQEISAGMEPRWVPFDEIMGIFGGYAAYDGKDEMRRGLYFREYTALRELEALLSEPESRSEA